MQWERVDRMRLMGTLCTCDDYKTFLTILHAIKFQRGCELRSLGEHGQTIGDLNKNGNTNNIENIFVQFCKLLFFGRRRPLAANLYNRSLSTQNLVKRWRTLRSPLIWVIDWLKFLRLIKWQWQILLYIWFCKIWFFRLIQKMF